MYSAYCRCIGAAAKEPKQRAACSSRSADRSAVSLVLWLTKPRATSRVRAREAARKARGAVARRGVGAEVAEDRLVERLAELALVPAVQRQAARRHLLRVCVVPPRLVRFEFGGGRTIIAMGQRVIGKEEGIVGDLAHVRLDAGAEIARGRRATAAARARRQADASEA
eukprot:scaffold5584_cov110-Isochrysis_galbana.AAC.4